MEITWSDFEKIDIRVGTIVAAQEFLKARKPAYQLSIDFGDELGIRRSSAQITTHYTPDGLVGMQVVAVLNFPAKQIANFVSQCLVLGVVGTDGAVVLLQPTQGVPNGLRIA